MHSDSEISPRFGVGFRADIKTDDEFLRLFAQVGNGGWAASVYDMNKHEWRSEDEWARDAADAK